MKEFAITFITPVTIVCLIYLCGLLSSRPKNRIKLYFYSLLLLVIFSIPLSSFIISYPLITLVKTINDDNQSNVKSVIVLSAGIEKDILENWRPSNSSLDRTLLGKNYSDNLSIPLVISGGLTGSKYLSEAAVIRNYLKLENSILNLNMNNKLNNNNNNNNNKYKNPFQINKPSPFN